MLIQTTRLAAMCAISVAALAACSGGSQYADPVTPGPVPTPPPSIITVAASGLVKYFTDLFGTTSETTEPAAIDKTELAEDDKIEPAPV